MESTVIHLDQLKGRELYIARYLAALSRYRQLKAVLEEVEREEGADQSAESSLRVEVLRSRLKEAREQMQETAEEGVPELMLPSPDVGREMGYSPSHMRRLIRQQGPDGTGRIRAEKRGGKPWWLYVPDLQKMIDEGALYGPRRQEETSDDSNG